MNAALKQKREQFPMWGQFPFFAMKGGEATSWEASRMPRIARDAIWLAMLFAAIGCSGGSDDVEQTEVRHERAHRAETGTVKVNSAQRPHAAFRFTDMTAESGIKTAIISGRMPSTELLEVKKGGIAVIDVNNSGKLDLFIANGATLDDTENGPGWALYENLGDFRFRNITEQAGITHTRWAMGACVGDFTGNGYDDIYVTCYGPNVLLRNNGDGTFTDVSDEAGAGDDRWSTTCAWGDLTGDGMLDLYVANFMVFDHTNPPRRAMFKGVDVMGGPFGIPPEHDVLYINQGDGTFAEKTEAAGCLPREPAYGLNVAILDFTGDGLQDIYVGNDSTPNFFFVNQGQGGGEIDDAAPVRFVERGRLSGIATNIDGSEQATMGVAIGDVNGNMLPDVFTTNFSGDTYTLHVNIDGQFFDDQTRPWGLAAVTRPYLGWAAEFVDLNHDGQEELFMVNGHIYPQATRELMDSEYEQPPLLFQRTNTRFERVTDAAAGDWLFRAGRDRAAIFADLNGSGSLDLIVGELNAMPRILRNDGADPAGAWLIVELHDPREGIGNHRGLGSRVQAQFDDRQITRWIYSGACYQGSRAPYAHFGFPAGAEHVTLTITWPDGMAQTVDDVTTDQHLTITRE